MPITGGDRSVVTGDGSPFRPHRRSCNTRAHLWGVVIVIRFADVTIDTDRREVRRGGTPIEVQPQVFDVLVHLAEHRNRVVTKEELLDEVWQHRFVTESAITSRIKSARQAIGDNGREQRMIKTMHGRGYRFRRSS